MFEGQPAKTRPKLQPKEGSWKGSRYDHSGELRFQFTATVSCLPKTRWIRFMQIPIVIYPKKATGVMNGVGTIEVKNPIYNKGISAPCCMQVYEHPKIPSRSDFFVVKNHIYS